MHSNTLPEQPFPDPHNWTRMQVLVNAGLTAQNVTCDAQCWKTGPVRPMFLECHDIVSNRQSVCARLLTLDHRVKSHHTDVLVIAT